MCLIHFNEIGQWWADIQLTAEHQLRYIRVIISHTCVTSYLHCWVTNYNIDVTYPMLGVCIELENLIKPAPAFESGRLVTFRPGRRFKKQQRRFLCQKCQIPATSLISTREQSGSGPRGRCFIAMHNETRLNDRSIRSWRKKVPTHYRARRKRAVLDYVEKKEKRREFSFFVCLFFFRESRDKTVLGKSVKCSHSLTLFANSRCPRARTRVWMRVFASYE